MCYNAVKSCMKSQDLGVIQGSKIGPVFFYIYSSDFSSMCSRDESIPYADDTVLLYAGTSLEDFTDHVNNKLLSILEWCNCNKLSLNPLKPEFMVVSNKRLICRFELFIRSDMIKKSTALSTSEYTSIYMTEVQCLNEVPKSRMSQLRGVSIRLNKFLNYEAAKILTTNVYTLWCVTVHISMRCSKIFMKN